MLMVDVLCIMLTVGLTCYIDSPLLTTRCEDSGQVKMNIMVMISHCKIPHLGNNKMFCPGNKFGSSILVPGESVILCSVQSSE